MLDARPSLYSRFADFLQGDDGSWEPRPSRCRKPSEKMKDIIKNSPGSAKRLVSRYGKPDDATQDYLLHVDDAMPETAFDSASLDTDGFGGNGDNDNVMLSESMSPVDLGCSEEIGLNSDVLSLEHDSSSGDDDGLGLIDGLLDPCA